MKTIPLLIFTFLLFSCENKQVEVEFLEIDHKIARFQIDNNSDKDIERISLEIKFMDSSDQILLTDTLVHQFPTEHQNEKLAFLKAHEGMFMVEVAPDKSKKADVRILNVENIQED